jgi:ABC-type protease/lipase transport system fused ATPase/permease subunit
MILNNGAVQAFGQRDDVLPLVASGKALNGSKPPSNDGQIMDS